MKALKTLSRSRALDRLRRDEEGERPGVKGNDRAPGKKGRGSEGVDGSAKTGLARSAFLPSGKSTTLMSAAPVGNYYIYSFDGKLLQVYDVYGTLLKDFVYIGNRLAAEYDHVNTRLLYYTPDQTNSTRVVTDQGGNVIYSATYDPHGNVRTETGSIDPILRFSGKERDSESQLDYFEARYYDRSQYRFISADPVTALMPTRLISQMNLYSYCGNNPIIFVDPDGQSYLTFNYGTSKLQLYTDNNICVGEWNAANNVVPGKDTFGGPSKYKILGFRTEGSSGELDYGTPESTYGSWGMLVVLDNDSKIIHSGKEGIPDGWGRTGYQHATNGCIRTEDAGMWAMKIWDIFDKITYLYVYKEVTVALPASNPLPFSLTPPGPYK